MPAANPDMPAPIMIVSYMSDRRHVGSAAPHLKGCDRPVARALAHLRRQHGALRLLGLRLLPGVAFTGLNWGCGFAAVRRATFYWTTAVGILPACIVFSAVGREGARAFPGDPATAALVAGCAALVLVTWQARDPAFRGLRRRALAVACGGALAWIASGGTPGADPSHTLAGEVVGAHCDGEATGPAPRCCARAAGRATRS